MSKTKLKNGKEIRPNKNRNILQFIFIIVTALICISMVGSVFAI